MFHFSFKIYRYLYFRLQIVFSQFVSIIYFKINGIVLGRNFKSVGIPKLYIHRTASVSIGDNVKLNNLTSANQ